MNRFDCFTALNRFKFSLKQVLVRLLDIIQFDTRSVTGKNLRKLTVSKKDNEVFESPY